MFTLTFHRGQEITIFKNCELFSNKQPIDNPLDLRVGKITKYTKRLPPTMTNFKFINVSLLFQCFLERNEKGEHSLRKKCLYSRFFRSVFPHIWTEYGDILCKSQNLVRRWENKDRKNPNTDTFYSVMPSSGLTEIINVKLRLSNSLFETHSAREVTRSRKVR